MTTAMPLGTPQPVTVSRGVIVLSGYGIRLSMQRGHLIAEDGIAGDRRSGRFSRIGSGITRVIVLGHEGWITLEALRWLHEIGAAFLQVGRDGEVIATGAPSSVTDTKLRRAQAVAMGTEAGLVIARALIQEKVAGQARLVDRMHGHAGVRRALADAEHMVAETRSLDHLRFVESRAAAAYWQAWEALPIRFAGRDTKHVPAHWQTFGTRSSPLTAGPRKAATPANALLNYLYAILEAETRLAAIAVGCDPALGILHTDKDRRDSLACDLMEPIRPKVDDYVFDLLVAQTFDRSDFFETRDGNCRLMPPISRPLATTAPRWAREVAPVAEWIGGAFRALEIGASVSPRTSEKAIGRYRTPLTGANRSRPKHVVEPPAALVLPTRCRGCGTDLGKRKRLYCDACLPNAARDASAKAVDVQRQLRAIGADQRSSDSVRATHRAHAHEQASAQRAWEAGQSVIPTRAMFRREIAPLLAHVPTEHLMQGSRLSRQSCNRMKAGRGIPHPRHWDAIRTAAERYTIEHASESDAHRDPEFFAREINPFLKKLGAETIRRATGLSASYSRRVLHGHHVPHARHWIALQKAVRDALLQSEMK